MRKLILWRGNSQLQAYSKQVAELAATKERNRLARDIHDSLGHYLTVINVQLEKALAFRDKKPQEADQAVSDAKRLASEALQDVRRSVGALRATQELFSCIGSVIALVKQVRSNQLSIELHIAGSEEGFSKQTLISLYRAAQEGLTNILNLLWQWFVHRLEIGSGLAKENQQWLEQLGYTVTLTSLPILTKGVLTNEGLFFAGS